MIPERHKQFGKHCPSKLVSIFGGEEIYFSIPLSLELKVGQELVSTGDLGYWPEGKAFCIFFGPTPISRGDKIRPASAVTVFGRIIGDAAIFKQVASGAKITIEKEGSR